MVSFCLRKDYDDNEEAKGYVAISGGRGPGVIYDALFSVEAFNEVALALADCDGRVLGGTIAVTSVVSILATIEGVLSPILSPILGGIADTTPNRKLYLGGSFAIVLLTLLLQGVFYLSEDTERVDPRVDDGFLARPLIYSDGAFVALCGLILVNVLAYELSALLAVSYAPELTTDDTVQMGFIADSYAANNGSQLFFLLLALGVTLPLGVNVLERAAIAAFICVTYMALVFYWGFFRLGSRRDIDPELDTRFCGTKQILDAILHAWINYPEIIKYLVSWMFVAGAVQSSVALSVTYFQLYLGYSGSIVPILLGIALLCSVPGSILSRVWNKVFGIRVKTLYISVCLIYCALYLSVPFLLVAERVEPKNDTFSVFGQCDSFDVSTRSAFEAPEYVFYFSLIFVIVFGLMLGHVYPINTQFYALLIPGGQENTYYGIKVTFSKALGWLPPLIFTLISEIKDGDLRLALITPGLMFLCGGVIAYFIDVEKGIDDIKDTLKFRQGAGKLDPTAELDKVAVLLDDGEEAAKDAARREL